MRPKEPQCLLFEMTFPGLPPSINKMYGIAVRGGRPSKYLRKEGKDFKKAFTLVALLALGGDTFDQSLFYTLEVHFYLPIYFKNGNIKKWDCTNHVKALEDAFSDAVGVDDRNFQRVITEKHDIAHDAEPYLTIKISPYEMPFCGSAKGDIA